MPAGEIWRIEQGYLTPDPTQPLAEGRLRRTRHPDGRTTYTQTIKGPGGLVRTEEERSITAEAFDQAWPRTEGRRIRKLRTRVREEDLVWEIDRFLDLPIVLAECELPAPDAPLPIPGWLKPLIVREVTDEPEYRNYQLALRAGLFTGEGSARPGGDARGSAPGSTNAGV